MGSSEAVTTHRAAAANTSVFQRMAERFQMDRAAFEAVVSKTLMPNENVGKEHIAAFLLVADQYGLNPFTKEIFAAPGKGGGLLTIVSIDGWLKLMNEHPQFDGLETGETFDEHGNLLGVTATLHRKDRKHPIVCTEYLAECKGKTEPWTRWPRRMLRHKAIIQAARIGFSFAGIIDPDEADRIREAEVVSIDPPASDVPRGGLARLSAAIETTKAAPQDVDDDEPLPSLDEVAERAAAEYESRKDGDA